MYRRTKLRAGGLLAVLALFCVLIAVFVVLARCAGRAVSTVSLNRTYYFVVRECEDSTSAAVVGQVYQAGGAGYLSEGEVVVACYYLVSDAERVCSGMAQQGVEAHIRTRTAEALRFEGEEASAAPRVQANAELVDTCARMLFDAANGLERGERSQEEARAAIVGVCDALDGLRRGNTHPLFSRWNDALARMRKDCGALTSGILFSKDLRRLQTEMLLSIVDLSAYF